MKNYILLAAMCLLMTSCSENYSNGERIGLITQFSQTGVLWKSWEGHLNLTQTGMNSSSAAPFDFSIDNDHEDPLLLRMIDSAATLGWKVKLTYHETKGKNFFNNRGETNHFIVSCDVLDKNPVGNLFGKHQEEGTPSIKGIVRDTIYLVIYK
ncbi:hypothetical protein AB6805_30375 [Chitinophaga sp. RCC_12]|uniref:hypothetical protein n=1 Tax=Chitinophaga sp. RCC_12 TaxID=3239226 RepID=UPI00352521EB